MSVRSIETSTPLSSWILIKERGNNSLSEKDLEFWSQNPPQEVILATGSVRKALMFSTQLYGLRFPGLNSTRDLALENNSAVGISFQPLDLQDFFKKEIFNGNGALKEKTLLGYLHGVAVYAQPSAGETEANEPYTEAVNKVMDLRKKYKNENVLIVSTDTVDRPENVKEPLGKPINNLDFPKPEDFESKSKYDQAVKIYLEEYRLEHYLDEQIMIHINAIAILDGVSGEVVDLPQKIIELKVPIGEKELANATPGQDMGGGGMTQQFVNWKDMKEILSYMDELMKTQMKLKEKSVILWALFCQISGMPFYAIKKSLQEANQMRNNLIIKEF